MASNVRRLNGSIDGVLESIKNYIIARSSRDAGMLNHVKIVKRIVVLCVVFLNPVVTFFAFNTKSCSYLRTLFSFYWSILTFTAG